MFFIKEIEVNGIWEKNNIKTPLFRDANIFIGHNGTGKTTLMNILTAILKVDAKKMTENKFKKAKIILSNAQGTIKTMQVNFESAFIQYKISRDTYKIPIVSQMELQPSMQFNSKYRYLVMEQRNACTKIFEVVNQFCQLNNISVHRELHDNTVNENEPRNSNIIAVDKKIQELTAEVSAFYRNIDIGVKNIFNKFQKHMLLAMLYDERFDTIEKMNENYPIEDLQKGLLNAYKNTGLTQIDARVKSHINKIESSLKVKRELQPGQTWQANDAFPLTSYMRSIDIVKELEKAENEKQKLLRPFDNIKEIFRSFCKKELNLDAYANKLTIKKDDIDLLPTDLSSGEKQMLILIFETIIQNNNSIISVTDEPELSLHIEWQRKILPAVRTINPSAQIVVATHSPEIAASYSGNVIRMEDILS